MKNFLFWLIPATVLISSAQAQVTSPYPPGTVRSPRNDYEVPTQQIGGRGWNTYTYVGSLRCRQQSDAIVGVRIRKGTVVDYMQVICAPVIRGQRGLFVGENYTGQEAGNTTGGHQRHAICNKGYAITGFMAVYTPNNSFLEDIRFECGRVVGLRKDAMFPNNIYVATNPNDQHWAGWITEESSINGQLYSGVAEGVADTVFVRDRNGMKVAPAQSRCGASATAFSVAVGKYKSLITETVVVQAFQMYCAEGAVDLNPAYPSIDTFQ